MTDVGIAFSEEEEEEEKKKKQATTTTTLINTDGVSSNNPEPPGNSNVGQEVDNGPSAEERELIAALERANRALEEEAKTAKATRRDEDLVAALEKANQGTDGSE